MALDFAAAYDELNPADHDHRFYAALAARLGATSALDLGCGTGTPARLLARRGLSVVAIDPDPEMLRVAGGRPGAELVDWRLGHSDRADPGGASFAVMSGHVAQVFRDDASWERTLHDLHRALVPGGTLAFESRNPSARAVLAFRDAETLRRSLEAAGFRLSFSYGDWDGKPEAAITPEIILVAQTPVCTNDRLY